MPRDSRFNVRLESKLVEEVKKYAKRNHTSVAALIESHFRELLARERTVVAVITTGEAEQV
jgi:hypothetical protein